MSEALKRPSMEELLSKRGASAVASARNPHDVLRVAQGQAPLEKEEEEGENEAPEKEAPKPESEPEKTEGETEKVEATKKEKLVPVSEVIRLREKNRELREKLRQLEEKKTEETGYWQDTQTTNADSDVKTNPVYKKYLEDKLASSWLAQRDKLGGEKAGELFSEFDKLCTEQEEVAPEAERIWDVMMAQPDPGRFIVDYVSNYKETEKYGTTPKEMREKIRAEVEAEVTKRVADQMGIKTKLRNQLPRDIVGSRSASGGSEEFQRPSAQDLYDRRKMERFKK